MQHPGFSFVCIITTAAVLAFLISQLSRATHPGGKVLRMKHIKKSEVADPRALMNSQYVTFYRPNGTFNWSEHDHSAKGLMFIKTHKTSSSTLCRLFYRILCEVKGMRCFLPNIKNPGKIWDLRKTSDYKYIASSAPYDVWVHHIKTPHMLEKFMDPGSFTVSVCRHPSHRFKSAWNWYGHEKRFGISFSEFIINLSTSKSNSLLQNRNKIVNESGGEKKLSFIPSSGYIFPHRTGLDSVYEEIIGLDANSWEIIPSYWLPDKNKNELLADLIQSMYHSKCFILVSDRLDESVLVLGMFMKWDIPEMMYLSQKVSVSPLKELTESDISVLEAFQPNDFALFRAANIMLDYYIQQYPGGVETFQEKLRTFQLYLSDVRALCASGEAVVSGDDVHNTSDVLDFTSTSLIREGRQSGTEHSSDNSNVRVHDSSKVYNKSTRRVDLPPWLTNSYNTGHINSSTEMNSISDMNSNSSSISSENIFTAASYCASLSRDNNEAVRFEWAKKVKTTAALKTAEDKERWWMRD